ncbi:MAG: N-6 DNA methylase, partial [Clostridia bacterium]|nr:N-6 DNA methylase [Clostridia bacterium]
EAAMYISVGDAALKFGISKRRVQTLCEQGRISGATMVSGVWLIPEDAPKPSDARKKQVDENQLSLFDLSSKVLTIDDVCGILSISKATTKNWIRLGKITPDVDGLFFSGEYIEKVVAEIRSENSTKLKSRRNKKSAMGKILYKDYVRNESNQKLVSDLLELKVFEDETDILVVLANFAVQLYYQSRHIEYSDRYVLHNFLLEAHDDDFHILIKDLIGNYNLKASRIKKLIPALTKEVVFVKGEDTLGFIYISLHDIGQRKTSGIYYTPEKIVGEMIERLYENDLQLNLRTICDPCCGTGNFLLSLGEKGIDYSNIYGQDVDPTSVCLARINIALMAPNLTVADLRNRIIIGNTFFETFERKFDVILGNPPWGSDFTPEEAERCRKVFKTAVGKNIESYDVFVEKTLDMLLPGGVLSFVLPEAILGVAAHEAVRRLILDCCSFKFISYLGNAFTGVQCPAIILGITKDYEKNVAGCRVSVNNERFTISQPRNFSDGAFAFNVSDEEYECLNTISHIENAVYLKENAKFALGIVTGNNKEFISDEKQDDNEVVLKGSDIYRYGFTPSDNYIRFEPEAFQQVAPAELYRAKEKLLYRFICEVPVFAYDDKQTLSLNSCNILIPEIEGLEMKYILAILNSSVAAYYISKKFNSVKLLRSHIEQLPIPKVSADVQEAVIKKADRIMSSSQNIIGLYEDLDKDIMALYGLDEEQGKVIGNALKNKSLFLDI